jgi:hypothetical protein
VTDAPAASGARARVTISRNDDRDVRHRQIYARIDDAPTRALLFGEAFTMELEPGAHRLRANNTLFWKTMAFSVEAGEHHEFVLVNRAPRIALGFLALFGAAPLMLSIERRTVRSGGP